MSPTFSVWCSDQLPDLLVLLLLLLLLSFLADSSVLLAIVLRLLFLLDWLDWAVSSLAYLDFSGQAFDGVDVVEA